QERPENQARPGSSSEASQTLEAASHVEDRYIAPGRALDEADPEFAISAGRYRAAVEPADQHDTGGAPFIRCDHSRVGLGIRVARGSAPRLRRGLAAVDRGSHYQPAVLPVSVRPARLVVY